MILLQLYILFYVLFNTRPLQIIGVCTCVCVCVYACVSKVTPPAPPSKGYLVGALEDPAGSGPQATLKTITLMEELGKSVLGSH